MYLKYKKTFFVMHNYFSFDHIKNVLHDTHSINLCGVLVPGFEFNLFKKVYYRQKYKYQDWIDNIKSAPVWTHGDIFKESLHEHSKLSSMDFNLVSKKILNDERTFYLMERMNESSNRKRKKGPFAYSWYICIALINILEMLRRCEPDKIVIQTTPHGIANWIFIQVAEYLKIPVYLIKNSPLPWRYWITKHVDKQIVVTLQQEKFKSLSSKALRYIQTNQYQYNNAKPLYEKKVEKLGVGEKWSWYNELKNTVHKNTLISSKRFFNSFHKKRIHKEYQNIVNDVDLNTHKNIVFFLHYQPERTSLPEGLNYTQQWKAISELSYTLPSNWRLYIKEHPSIFRRPIAPWVRPQGYYKSIANLPQTFLIPFNLDTFKLIDNSCAVATLTGTVGFEAICRGKPVITFGLAPFRNAPGAIPVGDHYSTKDAVDLLKNNTPRPSFTELEYYLKWVEANSFSASLKGNEDFNDNNIKQASFLHALSYALSL